MSDEDEEHDTRNFDDLRELIKDMKEVRLTVKEIKKKKKRQGEER